MSSWTYTFVPSPDGNDRHLEQRQQQISQMSRAEAMEYLRQMQLEVAETAHRFRKLLAKPVYRDMLQHGELWKNAAEGGAPATMFKLSKLNLDMLEKEMASIPMKYRPLINRLVTLPYTLKHNTKKAYVEEILKSRCILSLTEIHKRGMGKQIQGGTTHEGADDIMIHNEDFVFFRLSIGTTPAHSRFGPECFVFQPEQLFRFGWVSLHDMLSPASTERMCTFPTIKSLEQLSGKRGPFDKPMRVTTASSGFTVSHRYTGSQKTETQHRVQEVFYGGHIRLGIALSVVRELHRMMGEEGLRMGLAVCGEGPRNDALLLNLISNLFFVEAKIPKMFAFGPQELLKHYSDVPYNQSSKD